MTIKNKGPAFKINTTSWGEVFQLIGKEEKKTWKKDGRGRSWSLFETGSQQDGVFSSFRKKIRSIGFKDNFGDRKDKKNKKGKQKYFHQVSKSGCKLARTYSI